MGPDESACHKLNTGNDFSVNTYKGKLFVLFWKVMIKVFQPTILKKIILQL